MIPVYSPATVRMGRISPSHNRLLAMTLFGMVLVSVCSGQVAIPTSRTDNTRSGANTSETLLTPANVNKNQFGALFSYPIDYLALAQPLYIPNVIIQGQSHNVVYVATMADSVYAFDADTGVGLNGNPYLWWVNFTDPANGITTASPPYLPCSGIKRGSVGFNQEGIAGTPVIDTTTGVLYVIAKTMQNVNGTVTVYHHLHALDITSGAEMYGGPVQITAQTVYDGNTINFWSLHELNRPGLLLLNGVVYAGFGSNSCNDNDYGWLLAYDETTLQQVGSFNTSADKGLASIWQTGNGIAADENGNIFVVTAESTDYTVPQGGVSYCNSVLELTNTPGQQNSLALEDYFTPDNVAYLNSHDLDLSAGGPVVLPDQTGPATHLVVAGGKTGTVFVLNRDDMGEYTSNDGQLSAPPGGTGGQELDGEVGHLFDSPAYWNGMLYYAGDDDEIKAFALTGTYPPLSPAAVMATSRTYVGSHSPSISANGNNDGIVWVMSGGGLYAFNATNLDDELYNSNQNKARDGLPATAHFATQTIANGKVYIATQTTLSVYGLLQALTPVGGANQTAPILTTLPAPIQVQVVNPYTGVGIPNVSVTFSDGGEGGTFNPPNATSDANGNVSTSYTFSKIAGPYALTASSASATSSPIPETATPGPATQMFTRMGNKQSGQAGSILPTQLSVLIEDAYKNSVPGITVTYVDKSGLGTLNPSVTVTNSSGLAPVSYQLPNSDGKYKISASASASQCPTCKTQTFSETATGDAPASVVVVSGNNQSAPVNTALPQPLVVQVNDQGGNPIAGVSVTFSAPSGTLSSASVTTNASGQASVNYTTGGSAGTVTITAAVNALNTQFTVNVTD